MDQINDLVDENTKFLNKITQLNTEILFRKNILSTWQSAPPELRNAAEAAYNEAASRADNIKEALNEITNLKSVIIYINESFKSINVSEIQLHMININNLLQNYTTMKTAFLAKHGRLLSA
jgi:uncharacterized coiled-coil DUF342 family protein